MASSTAAASPILTIDAAEQFLQDAGFDVPHDLGGLRTHEIAEVLAPIGSLTQDDLDSLRQRGQSCLLKRDARFLDPACILPAKKTKVLSTPLARMSTSSALCAPSRPMQVGTLLPQDRTSHIAAALVHEVVLPHWSAMWSELDALSPADQNAWRASLADSLASQFQFGTLSAALRSFRRLVQWLSDSRLPLKCPNASDLRSFLLQQSRRGRTVPSSILRQFLWFEERLKVPFQVRSPLLCDLMCQKASTLPTQAQVLTPQVWKHLIDLCSREASGWTGLQLSAALVVRYVVSGTSTLLEQHLLLTCLHREL